MAPSKALNEMPKEQRIEQATQTYKLALTAYETLETKPPKPPSMERIALDHGLVPSTLRRRIAEKTHTRQQAHEHRQRLTPIEEKALLEWTLQTAA